MCLCFLFFVWVSCGFRIFYRVLLKLENTISTNHRSYQTFVSVAVPLYQRTIRYINITIFVSISLPTLTTTTDFQVSRRYAWFQAGTTSHLWSLRMSFKPPPLKRRCRASNSPQLAPSKLLLPKNNFLFGIKC